VVQSGWETAVPSGRARGIATSNDVNTVVAHVAEVGIEENQIRVYKMTSVVDPGLVINPDGAIAQTQGGIVMGLSSTLREEITIRNGKITAGNFDAYPLLTMRETPDIAVTLLESGDEPFGMGEPPIGPVAAAVANALFALTGQRLRRLPLRMGE
jgi:isoquinoline 1-oxidoreductase beta subunit